MIELQLLGPPVVRVDGSDPPPELLWRKHLALLVYLARSARPRTRDHLVGLLWPDKEESKARHSLNEALRVIRRCAGDALRTDGDNVQLGRDVVHTDIESADVHSAPGIFLDGFTVPDAPAFEDWMTAERETIRAASLERLVADAELGLAEGRLSSARALAEMALEIESLHEPAVRALMQALALEGGRTLALKAYGRFREQLARDLDVEPSRETESLAEFIRNERLVPGVRALESIADEVVPVVGMGRVVLAACVDAWHESLAGRPTVVVVRGDPGTGKTRTADEVAARARLDGAVVSYARAIEGESAESVWTALLKGGLDVPELSGAAPQVLAALGALEPDLLTRYPAAREADPKSGIAETFGQAISAIAESRPVLLVLDDASKALRPTLEVLGSIVQRAGQIPLCVLATVSKVASESVDSLSERLGRDIHGSLVETSNFLDADVSELVAWGFPHYDDLARDRLTRRVLADTAGNPFLATELVRAVREGLNVGETESSATWPQEARTLDHTIPGDLPETVSASLRTRFRGLSEHARELLIAAAVLGGNTPIETLAQAGEIPVEEAARALDELELQRWLVADSRGYAFVTGLAGAVVLADMVTRGKQRRILERAGR